MLRLPLLLAVTMVTSLLSLPTASAAEQSLEALRQQAEAQLQQRWQDDIAKGPALDLVLRLDQAFLIHPLVVRLPWRGGAWQQPVLENVPEDVLVQDIDISALKVQWDADGAVQALSGDLLLTWTPRTLIEHGGWQWQYRLQKEHDDYAQRQERIRLNTSPQRNSVAYLMHAEGAIDGEKGLHVQLERRDGAWISANATSPKWNRANHVVNPDAFTLSDAQQLAGGLDITLLADGWVPSDGEPRPVRLEADTRIDELGIISGTYSFSGSLGERSGNISGRRRQQLLGSYRFDREQALNGRLRVHVEPVTANSTLVLSVDEADDETSQSALRSALATYMAWRNYPRTIDHAYQAIMVANTDLTAPERAASYADWLASALNQGPMSAQLLQADPRFGPHHGDATLPINDGINQIPVPDSDAPQRWQRLSAWQVIGPFGVERFAEAPMPEILPPHSYPADALGRSVVEDAELAWEAVDAVYRDPVPGVPERQGGRDWDAFERDDNRPQRSISYASTTIEVAADGSYYLALKAIPAATQLWINQRRVVFNQAHTATLTHNHRQPLILEMDLPAGQHHLLLRLETDFEATEAQVWVCTAGSPETMTEAPLQASLPAPQQHGWRGLDNDGRYSDAEPPLAWDHESGLNVAWRTSLPQGHGGIAVWDGLVVATAAGDRLLAFDLESGESRWQVGEGETDASTASTTPVASANGIWAWFGSGRTLHVDHQGTLQWSVDSGLQASGSHLASPILIDNMLIIQGTDPEANQVVVMALDAESGEQRWRLPLSSDPVDFLIRSPRGDVRWYWDGMPGNGWGLASMRLHHGEQHRDVIITHDGALITADDGNLITRRMPIIDGNRTPPLIDGNRAYFSTSVGHAALELWLESDGRIGYRQDWLTRRRAFSGNYVPLTGSGAGWVMPPLLIDGQLYIHRVHRIHRPRHAIRPYAEGDVYDPHTGRYLANRWDLSIPGFNPSLPMIQAGQWLLAGNSGHNVMSFSEPHGHLNVALPGLPPQILIRNPIDRSYASPVAVGPYLLIRGHEALTAYAALDDEGMREQWNRIAEEQMAQIPARPRGQDAAPIAATPGDFHSQDKVPVVDVQPGICFGEWLVLGPLPANSLAETPNIGSIDSLPHVGESLDKLPEHHWWHLSPRDHTIMSTRFAPEFHWTSDQPSVDHRIDLTALTDGRPQPGTVLMTTVISIPETITATLVSGLSAGNAQAWIGGQPVELDSPLRLEAGTHPLLLRIDIGRLPPFVRGLEVKPHLALTANQADATAEWYDIIRQRSGILQRIAEQDGNRYAARASRLLAMLAEYEEEP